MKTRRPRTAAQSHTLPSLAALLASGVAVQGCNGPDDPAQRQGHLSTHGTRAAEAFNDHRFGDAFHEIGVGLGIFPATIEHDLRPAGAMPIANPEPPVEVAGAMAPVQPTPPPPPEPPPPQVHPSGGAVAVHPQPPPPVESPAHHHRR